MRRIKITGAGDSNGQSPTTRQTAKQVGGETGVHTHGIIMMIKRTRIRNLSSIFFSAAVRVSLILARLVVEVVAVVEFSSSGSFLRFFFFFLDFFFLPPNDSPPFSFNLPAVTWSDMLWAVLWGAKSIWLLECQTKRNRGGAVDEDGFGGGAKGLGGWVSTQLLVGYKG